MLSNLDITKPIRLCHKLLKKTLLKWRRSLIKKQISQNIAVVVVDEEDVVDVDVDVDVVVVKKQKMKHS